VFRVNKVFDWLGGALIVAGIFVMVRPRSQGPDLVKNLGSAVTGVFTAITGGGTF
jgi:drug/metabolite transporter (DMT)-like permease